MKLVSSIFNVNFQWLETGKGEMFYADTEREIEEIVSLYKRLSPFFRKFIVRQLYDLVELKKHTLGCAMVAATGIPEFYSTRFGLTKLFIYHSFG
jgi:hypothetical protein